MDNTLLSVKGLEVGFDTEQGLAKVLDKVNFEIMPGEIVGLVGESGCGKTTLARAILGVLPKNNLKGQLTQFVGRYFSYAIYDLFGGDTLYKRYQELT